MTGTKQQLSPPASKEAAELWAKLLESPAPSEVVDFPRKDAEGNPVGRIRIQVLEMPDHDWARLEAHKWIKDKGLDVKEVEEGPTLKEVYGDAVARHLLSRAVLTVDPIEGSEATPGGVKYGRPFPTPDYLDALTADELQVLFSSYLLIQHKFGPYADQIQSDEELSAWVKRLVEGASTDPLGRFTWLRLVELSFLLATRVYSLSACLEYQCSSSPSTSVSPPSGWRIGTSYFGARHANTIAPGLIPVPDGEDADAEPEPFVPADDDPLLKLPPGEPITIADAAEFARSIGLDMEPDPEL